MFLPVTFFLLSTEVRFRFTLDLKKLVRAAGSCRFDLLGVGPRVGMRAAWDVGWGPMGGDIPIE